MAKTSKPSLADTHPKIAHRSGVSDPLAIDNEPNDGRFKPTPGRMLPDLFPEIAAEAHGWDPTLFAYASFKKQKWSCPKVGHIYEMRIASRTSQGSGCNYCSGKKVLNGFNDLATTNPEVAAEAHGWDPKEVTAGSGRKLNWKCKDGHVWLATVANRSRGTGCPYCSGRKVLEGKTDLATKDPILASEAYGWDPKTLSHKSNLRRKWKCVKDHVYEASVDSRSRGRGCPYCSGNKVLVGFNDLASVNPSVAAQARGWDPTKVSFGHTGIKEWECAQGHIFQAKVAVRNAGIGCGICSNHVIVEGINDLKTTHPELANELINYDPTKVSAGTKRRLLWQCKCGHSWYTTGDARRRGAGCPRCSGHVVNVGVNDLATLNPDLASEAHGWDPSQVAMFSNRKLEWKCRAGHFWKAHVASRSNGNGCPICSNRALATGVNDLATLNPDLASEAHGWDPSQVHTGSGLRVPWICLNGHVWLASVRSRHWSGYGCPACSISGFDQTQKSFIYLVEHDDWDLFQIGITGHLKDRLKYHAKIGWSPVEVRGPMEGLLAQDLETAILKSLKKRNATFANQTDRLQFGGWTEAWTKDSLQVTSIKQLLGWVYEDESQ
jgi:hypothetical protein